MSVVHGSVHCKVLCDLFFNTAGLTDEAQHLDAEASVLLYEDFFIARHILRSTHPPLPLCTMTTRSVFAATALFAVVFAVHSPLQLIITQAEAASSGASVQAQSSSRSTAASKSSKSSVSKTVPLTCMQKAALKREEAIGASLDSFHADLSRMLDLRQSLIVKYWGEKDEKKRDAGLKTVWRSFGQAWRTSGLYMKAERKKLWMQYRADKILCGMGITDPESGGLSLDSQY